MKELSLSKVYRLIEPGPVVLVVTAQHGVANVMAATSLMMARPDPPLIALGLGPWNHSHAALRASGECVLAVPGVDMVETAVDIGNCSGADMDKFAHFGLVTSPAAKVAPPLLPGCLANVECRVLDDRMAEDYDLFILDPVRAWFAPDRDERRTFHHNGDGTFVIDGPALDLRARMVKWPEFLD
ncbi:MAG: flavin reductase family protein [Desulfovibrionaceae bacterium]|nr:flavin reductase family protein [Desulfovibrionaceae bacterium]